MKNLSIYLLLCSSFAAKAQWTGPTSGTLSTTNRVQINYTAVSTSPPQPRNSTFSVVVNSGVGTPSPSLRIYDDNGAVEVGRNMLITHGAQLTMTRANNTNVLQVSNIGNMRLTTDGFINQHRGFFINNGTFDFYSVTQQGILYKDQTSDIFKVTPNGYAYARKMVVTLANPFTDYVFETNYKLMPLTDLAAFIAKNKHLPNLPSAKQVADNNNQVELGEMQALLLEKVEELTLYILQQQQQIEELQRKLADKQ